MPSLTREQVRRLDRIAVERFGIPSITLMENAGRGATDVLLRRLSPTLEDLLLVVAGKGNNGGDGFVIARHLVNRGYRAEIAVLCDADLLRRPGDVGTNFVIAERMRIPIHVAPDGAALGEALDGAGLVIDAVLGTGLIGEVRGAALAAIDAMNDSGLPVFAVDIPSGLDCDTGCPLGASVRADATATFAALKVGFEYEGAAAYTGRVDVVDIGCPVVWE